MKSVIQLLQSYQQNQRKCRKKFTGQICLPLTHRSWQRSMTAKLLPSQETTVKGTGRIFAPDNTISDDRHQNRKRTQETKGEPAVVCPCRTHERRRQKVPPMVECQ